MILYYVRGVRQNMVKGAARVNDLIGPFDTWSEASRYATAWRALWVQQHAKAFVETPITPCSDTLEWYGAKVERDDAAELARRERAADDMFASEAREATRPGDSAVAQWFASDAREAAPVHSGFHPPGFDPENCETCR